MEDLSSQDVRNSSKSEKEDKITYNNIRTNSGICCICRKPPIHTKNYYGHVFCTDCFYKYIFSPAKTDCSGDVTKRDKDAKEDQKEGKEEEKEVTEDAATTPSTLAVEVAK
ncbi:hypothetical protein PYW07_011344 [Mythimna separata]|uniref:Uncharacterized protein n=1 Tax=Mythimna separata TaxID=271217 RepID=A0AAD8DL54_MYTSE|nr:hypothetical protein PYW07_011344 [Mythimna separata]